MKKYLPSKKLTLIFLAIAVVIAGGFFFFTRKTDGTTAKKDKAAAALTAKNIVLQEIIDRDADGDGIKDWEEALWGTDASKIDSDGDGVTDFDYISKKKSELAAKNPQEDGTTVQDNTDNFARELFTAIISLRESGNLNAATMSDLSNQLAKNIGSQKVLRSVYQTSDMKVTGNTPKEKLAYDSKWGALLSNYENSHIGEELDMVASALDSNDPGLFKKLKEIGEAYISFSKDLIAIPVPEEISIKHLSLANSLQKTGVAIENMSLLSENELIGMVGIGQYGPYSSDVDVTLDRISDYLNN